MSARALMMAVRAVSAFAAVMVAALAPVAQAGGSAFRGHAALGSGILDELEGALGAGLRRAAEGRAPELEDAMRTIFKSLPKTDDGRLPWAGVRYLLHRVFVERHAWQVHGIVDSGEGWNAARESWGSVVFVDHAGDQAAEVLERRLGGQGLSLQEAAVVAATLESMVHEEVVERLHAAYRLAHLETQEADTDDSQINLVLDMYMAMYTRELNHTELIPEDMEYMLVKDPILNFDATRRWVREVRDEVLRTTSASHTSFATTARVVEELMNRHGRWQAQDCHAIKADLMKLERNGTGRVLLRDFYGAAMNGQHLFTEAKDYLRELGVLDETVPSQPAVIIPNYLNAPSNCLAGSKFYSVCCINECEGVLKTLEENIAAPEASVHQVVNLVERLPSSTITVNRKLPDVLVSRLEEIASYHGGQVPLHGRLFAQWLHHAYPRECPYPHLSGTTSPVKGPEWAEKNGVDFMLYGETLEQHYVETLKAESSAVDDSVEVPWCSTEELQLHTTSEISVRGEGGGARVLLRQATMLGVVASMTWALLSVSRAAANGRGASPFDKYV